jgi:hypothetical protein
MEKRRPRITLSGATLYRDRTFYVLYKFNRLSISSKFSIYIATYLLQQTKASSTLLEAADLSRFLRP